MGYIAKLSYNGGELDLTQSPYNLAESFTPPMADEVVQVAGGTVLNEFDAGQLIAVTGENYGLSVPLILDVSSDADGNYAVQEINRFIRRGLSENNDVWFEWRSDNNAGVETREGVWGSNQKCRVIWGECSRLDDYGAFNRGAIQEAEISLSLAPYIHTNQLRTATAGGAVFDVFAGNKLKDVYGTTVCEAATNEFINPLFENGAQSWTLGSGIRREGNKDKRFILWGEQSNYFSGVSGTESNNRVYMALTLTNTETYFISFYILSTAGTVPTESMFKVYYDGSDQTTTFTKLGNTNWYRAEAEITGDGTSNQTGFHIFNSYAFYVTAGQCEQNDEHPTQFFYGEMPGCAWSGSSHASTTTRAAGSLKANKFNNQTEGTAAFVWQSSIADSERDISSGFIFFRDTSGLFICSYSDVTKKISFVCGGATATSATFNLTRNQVIVVHCTWSKANGVKLYINGSVNGTGATMFILTAINDIYIGHRNGVAGAAAPGVFLAPFILYDKELTATQVANDYNNMLPLAGDLKRIDYMPYLWTKDADDNIDVVNDATRDDYGFVSGVPGNVAAATYWQVTHDFSNNYPVYISIMPLPEFIRPDDLLADMQGTVLSGALNGEVQQDSVLTTASSWPASAPILDDNNAAVRYLSGMPCYFKIRLANLGAPTDGLQAAPVFLLGSVGDTIVGDYQNLSIGTTLGHEIIGPITFPKDLAAGYTWLDYTEVYYQVSLKRPSGSSNVNFDYARLLPGSMTLLRRQNAVSTAKTFVVDGRQAFDMISAQYISTVPVEGDLPLLWPNLVNHISFIPYLSGTADNLTDDFTVNRLLVTPRWQIS